MVYDLSAREARHWHEASCRQEECWCTGAGVDREFLKRLSQRLSPVGFRTSMEGFHDDALVLVRGPGVDERDAEAIREAVARV